MQPGPHGVDEAADHAELDVGLEQGRADLAQGLVEVGVGEAAAAAQAAGDPLEAVGEGVEHAEGQATGRASGPGLAALSRTGRRRTRSGSKGTRSSGPSPSPTSFTGRPSSRWMATTIPPLAVPSSLVSTTPVTPTASVNWRAWARPFWPVVASRTSSTSVTRPGGRSATRRIFFSSSTRLTLVWSRPAVSARTRSLPRAAARCTASKTTALGSPPSAPRTISAPARSAQRGQLLGGRGPEGVAGGQEHRAAVGRLLAGHLADGRGLAHPVHPDEEPDVDRPGLAVEAQRPADRLDHLGVGRAPRSPAASSASVAPSQRSSIEQVDQVGPQGLEQLVAAGTSSSSPGAGGRRAGPSVVATPTSARSRASSSSSQVPASTVAGARSAARSPENSPRVLPSRSRKLGGRRLRRRSAGAAWGRSGRRGLCAPVAAVGRRGRWRLRSPEAAGDGGAAGAGGAGRGPGPLGAAPAPAAGGHDQADGQRRHHDDGQDDPQGEHGDAAYGRRARPRAGPGGDPSAGGGRSSGSCGATFWLTTWDEPPGAMVTP